MFSPFAKHPLRVQQLSVTGVSAVRRLRHTVVEKAVSLLENSVDEVFRPLVARLREGHTPDPCPKIRQLLDTRYPWIGALEWAAVQAFVEESSAGGKFSEEKGIIQADSFLSRIQTHFEVLEGLGAAARKAAKGGPSLFSEALSRLSPLSLVIYERYLEWRLDLLPKRKKEHADLTRRLNEVSEEWGRRLAGLSTRDNEPSPKKRRGRPPKPQPPREDYLRGLAEREPGSDQSLLLSLPK